MPEEEARDTIVVPVVAETLSVDKAEEVTGGVRIRKVVREQNEIVDPVLLRSEADVVRVPCDQYVNAAPEVRYEGETMIVSVVEEVLVVEKRLRVKEEIRITPRRTEYRSPQTVVLRSEEVQIERWSADVVERHEAH